MNENTDRPIEKWWTDDQKALVENLSPIWLRKSFEKVPGIWITINGGKLLRKLSKDEQIPEGAVLDKGAWDHERCALCWQTISEYPTDQQEGYFDGGNWLCMECYSKYIVVSFCDSSSRVEV
jgi:hypothetical protein